MTQLDSIHEAVDTIYRTEGRRIFATLVRLLGDLDLAEEALQDAFASALEKWPNEGIPSNPRAWLVSTGRFKAIDVLRRRARFDASMPEIAERYDAVTNPEITLEDEGVADDQLRLIFTCCHPALPAEGRIALTLREVCGLTTEEIAKAFLTSPATVAQRIVRAKAKIRDTKIPYRVPSAQDLPERLETALHVIYLVFNEGYSASSGPELTRADLSGEAIRLGELLIGLLPDPDAIGLLGLMLLQESRRKARSNDARELILLENQDRTLWNRDQIARGVSLVERAFVSGQVGTYTIQAAIAAVHAQAENPGATNWDRIVRLYDILSRVEPSPIVALNRAVAVAMRDGPEAGLGLIDAILATGDLDDYYLAHSARAEFCRRLGRNSEAQTSFERALSLTAQVSERRFLEQRIAQLRQEENQTVG